MSPAAVPSPLEPRDVWSLRRSTRLSAVFGELLPRVGLCFPGDAVDVPMAFSVAGEGVWTVRLRGGRAVATEGRGEDAHLHLAMDRATWKAVVGGRLRDVSRELVEPLGWLDVWPDTRGWLLDAPRAEALRGVQGVLAFVVRDRAFAEAHRFVIGFGAPVEADAPADVTLTIDLEPLKAFLAARPGPRELRRLLGGGQVRVDGDLALPTRLLAAVLPQDGG